MVTCYKKEQVMSEKNRKNFSSQFKAKVAIDAIRGVKTVNEIAQGFGVHQTQVGHWKKVLQEKASGIFRPGVWRTSDPSWALEESVAGKGFRHI
jgi:transposase-like protein